MVDVLGVLLVWCLVGSFDQLAGLEAGAGSDQGDQVGAVDRAPAALGGLQQLEHHRQPGVLGARPLGDPGPGLTGENELSIGLVTGMKERGCAWAHGSAAGGAGEPRSTVRPSGTGASGSKRRSGRPLIVRWAASPS